MRPDERGHTPDIERSRYGTCMRDGSGFGSGCDTSADHNPPDVAEWDGSGDSFPWHFSPPYPDVVYDSLVIEVAKAQE